MSYRWGRAGDGFTADRRPSPCSSASRPQNRDTRRPAGRTIEVRLVYAQLVATHGGSGKEVVSLLETQGVIKRPRDALEVAKATEGRKTSSSVALEVIPAPVAAKPAQQADFVRS